MGYSLDDDYVSDFWDKAEAIPGGFIIQRELQKALKGEQFFYNRTEDGKPVRINPVDSETFLFYYLVWEDFHYTKILPHGKGTAHERRWVIEVIKILEKAHMSVQAFAEAQAYKNTRR